MPKSPMTDKFANRAPKFGDEGEPEESPRGTAAGPDDSDGGYPSSGPPNSGGLPGGQMSDPVEAKAVDDMGDILGIGPEDRADFGNALKAYVQSCLANSMGGAPGPDEMPMPEGGDEDDEEQP